jgi:putative nucleotidyltransferase with HDIG domain
VLIAGYSSYLEGSRLATKARRALLPLLPSEAASALLAVGIVWLYVRLGLVALPLTGAVLLAFQYLVGALLLSQQRGEELELRARQLAGFQVGLLSALIRTLDLRDQMTARHSAAVARYAREIAAEAGLPPDEQELAHTAGILHDIGKFTFPDRLLSGNAHLDEDDWRLIRMHPHEGARIVSQVDGFQPVGEIIVAHHERLDGGGYPRGLRGEEIPMIARIIAVADVYDVLTARDTYRKRVSSQEAIAELRRLSGTQLDGRFVVAFEAVLTRKDRAYRHGEDVDFDAELALERLIQQLIAQQAGPERAAEPTSRAKSLART